MRALVTGGAGFIGSHLTEALLERGDEVVVLDDLSTGRLENLVAVSPHPRLRFVEGNVLDRPLVRALAEGCQQVYHLAAAVGVRLILERPVETLRANVGGTESVLEAAREVGCKLLLASTSEVYGDRELQPLREDDPYLGGPVQLGRWAYAASKVMDEFLALAFRREFGLPVVVVRLFNTVGPRQRSDYGMVVPTFVQRALRGEPLLVFGDGSQRRCFVDVADSVPALLALMEEPRAVGEVVNVGTDREVTIRELAERVVALVGSPSPVQLIPYRDAYGPGYADMVRRVPSLAKLRSLTRWEPRHSLEDTLRRVIRFEAGRLQGSTRSPSSGPIRR